MSRTVLSEKEKMGAKQLSSNSIVPLQLHTIKNNNETAQQFIILTEADAYQLAVEI